MDYDKFYERLIEENRLRRNDFPNKKIFTQRTGKYHTDAFSYKGFKYNFVLSSQRSAAFGKNFEGLIVELYIDNIQYHDSYFQQLKEHQVDIENELDIEAIVWQPSEDTTRGTVCRVFAKKEVNIDDESKWDEYIEWQLNTMSKFLEVLPKYTNGLDDIGVYEMIDYNGFKEYMVKIGFAPSGIATYLSYISENKLEILNKIPDYTDLNDVDKLKKFAKSDSSLQETFDQYHNYAKESTFSDLRSGARRYVLYLKYCALLETMNNYKKSPELFDTNGAYMFFKIFDNSKSYPVKSICRKNQNILELSDGFTTDNGKSKLSEIFNHRNNSNNITFVNNKDPYVKDNNHSSNSSIKNIILYGSPGVGKTHNTKKLISLIESGKSEKDIFEIIKNNDFNDVVDIEYIKDRVKFITFHQSFGYEDFIEGFRPNDEGKIELEKGIFLEICKEAGENLLKSGEDTEVPFRDAFKILFKEKIENEENITFALKRVGSSFKVYDYNEKTIYFEKQSGNTNHTLSIGTLEKMYDVGENHFINGGLAVYYQPILDKLLEIKREYKVEKIERKNYYLVIDEINRGNISKIFGELITLIEEDKRDTLEVTLPYSKKLFKIPSNLYIIGTMNSTDKSIALIDIALRRRFTFLKMEPNLELVGNKDAKIMMEQINAKIEEKLGKDYLIGHSYFMGIENENENDLSFVLEYKIKPLLEEYYYGDTDGLKEVCNIFEN